EQGIDGAAGNAKPMLQFPSPEQTAEKKALNARIDQITTSLENRKQESSAELARWVAGRREQPANSTEPRTPVDPILAIADGQRTQQQQKQLLDYFLENHDKPFQQLVARRTKVRKQRDALDIKIPSTMVMQDLDRPRPTYILERGLFDQHGEIVKPAVPSALPPLPEGAPANRLGLARWLTSPSHPLTARVTVNRYWQMLFGTGIVKTSENFGAQGDLPSHPVLLDWLASEFVENDWDVKAIMKRMVMSATYRQSSITTPGMRLKDPENRLLARASRFRMPAELIRDNAMAISGLLVRKIGGPSVRPYQPEGLWADVSFGIKTYGAMVYQQDHGEALYRRGMYTFWKRSCPPPSLLAFDAPEREICTVRRERTNTPLQALALLNDPTYLETARSFAQRIMKEGGSEGAERVRYAFRMATGRHPTESEQQVLMAEYHVRLADYRQDMQAALSLLDIGESSRDETLDVSQLAAWTMVARLILNLDETITKA
ncbi:MAG: DUF1553 domain-containing protein, partial [Planctomycetales bacterium]